MKESIALILWAWALLSPLLFRFLPSRDAAIVCLIAGWAFLPVESYPASSFSPEQTSKGLAHALALPQAPTANKATAIGLGALIGVALFDRRRFVGLRMTRFDLSIIAWCLIPIGSAMANRLPISEGLTQARYLALAWGVPYLLGRAYLTDEASRVRFAIGIVVGGLVYLPICLIEGMASPILYPMLYGPHPYLLEGSSRLVGYRPNGILEDGNQLGIWMASAAVAATWLSATGSVRRFGEVPSMAIALILVVAVVACQSHSSILLMGLALTPLIVARSRNSWRILGLAILGSLGLSILAGLVLLLFRGFDLRAIRLDVRSFFHLIQKSSVTWRLARIEESLEVGLEKPWFGWARANWARGGVPFAAPVGISLWLHAFGMFGILGLAGSMATWFQPIIRSIYWRWPREWTKPARGGTGALALILVVNTLDCFSNSVAILPMLAIAGGLNSVSGNDRAHHDLHRDR